MNNPYPNMVGMPLCCWPPTTHPHHYPLRQALRVINHHVEDHIRETRMTVQKLDSNFISRAQEILGSCVGL